MLDQVILMEIINIYLKTVIINGNDVINAPNVTIVSKTKDLYFEDEYFDTIISTECFEHDPEYTESFLKIYKILKPGGLFVFTCASTGRPEHGTRRTSANDSYGTIGDIYDMRDYYKNLTEFDLNNVLHIKKLFKKFDSYYNQSSKDLYFWGIKNDNIIDNTIYPDFLYNYVIKTTNKFIIINIYNSNL